MKRYEVGNELAERIPKLLESDAAEWKLLETARLKFVSDYPIRRIPNLTLDQYVIGKGNKHHSFCYRVERELDRMGRILGTPANKFGVYFGIEGDDEERRYRNTKKWGTTVASAFSAIKAAISELLIAAENDDIEAIYKSKISPLFLGKLLFLYFPQKFVPIYSEAHLHHFAAELNLSGMLETPVDMQRALSEYQQSWSELRDEFACLFMRFLYEVFGYPDDETIRRGSKTPLPLLPIAVNGAKFIDEMPEIHEGSGDGGNSSKNKKPDYDRQSRQRRRIGERGEQIVLFHERRRLTEFGKQTLATKVQHVSETDDRLGYDIRSFDEDGTPRYIEVKATVGANLSQGFYVTNTELRQASELRNYYVYFVFSALTTGARIYPLAEPKFGGEGFDLEPQNYLVRLRKSE